MAASDIPPPVPIAAETNRSLAWALLRLRESIPALWRAGAHGQPPTRAREIKLTNSIAILAAGATLPYQAFYLTAISHYIWVFAVNLLFIAAYAAAPLLNRAGRFGAARAVAVGSVYVQLFVITALISTAAGVHLFYFALGASLGAVFASRDRSATLWLIGLGALLFVVCHIAFPPGTTPIVIPEATTRVMYVGSAAGAVLLTGGFSYLFRVEIDRAEAALTQSNRVLQQLTTVDPVTGLANRRAMDAYLAHQWKQLEEEGYSVAVALIDVDCFKAFNDHYGHLAGDKCLERVADALRAATRRHDDLIARFGGEEFVIVLPATNEDFAAQLAEQVRLSIMRLGIPHDYSGVAPVVTVSIGVAGGNADELGDFAALLHRADSALYAAKHAGRNCVVRWQALEDDATLTARRRRLAVERERARA